MPWPDAVRPSPVQRGQNAPEPINRPVKVFSYVAWLKSQMIDNARMNVFLKPYAAMPAMLPKYATIRLDLIVEMQRNLVTEAESVIGTFNHAAADRKIIEESLSRSFTDFKIDGLIDLDTNGSPLIHTNPRNVHY
jgi:hypothetical protein